ncbi:hypothetical protein O181_002427 [Austropuccinia psidii MF-1]|uniref:Uncharacterized protein n=1 Tax=Austropuccinia psidii MF-1 TaxID=1389203 RepID=A0A9Q3BCG1_9BASI|nr:hypothetical protein [Austropuccinia psidii MF-1]
MGQLTKAVSPKDNKRAPTFNTPSMKAQNSFDGNQDHKLRGFIQSCQLIFHNYQENFFSDSYKALESTSFITDRAGKWIEPYLLIISNEDPSYLLNNLQLFKTQLFSVFGDPNEIRKAEQELENLRMKESGHFPLCIPDFRSLIFDSLQELMDITLELDTTYHVRKKEKGSHQEKKSPFTGSNSLRPPQN